MARYGVAREDSYYHGQSGKLKERWPDKEWTRERPTGVVYRRSVMSMLCCDTASVLMPGLSGSLPFLADLIP